MTNILRKSLSLLEKFMVTVVTICAGSYITANILDGITEMLQRLGETTATATSSAYPAFYYYVMMFIWIIHWMISGMRGFSNGIFQITRTIVSKIHEATFVMLLRNLYLNGPSFHGWGFWSGKREEEICGNLTGTEVSHWKENPAQCKNRIETDIQSIVLGVECILILILSIKYISYFWGRILKGGGTPPSSPKHNYHNYDRLTPTLPSTTSSPTK